MGENQHAAAALRIEEIVPKSAAASPPAGLKFRDYEGPASFRWTGTQMPAAEIAP